MQKAANLLWTSGWDSTYRLLELLLVHKRPVQTYYLFDRNRHSYQLEVQAIEKIREVLLRKHPEVKQLLLPMIFKEVSEIKPNARITRQYQDIVKHTHIGSQYEWLARYADEAGINDLELCVHMRTPGFFQTYLLPNLLEIREGNEINYGLKVRPDDPILSLFGYFRFPLQDSTKKDHHTNAVKYRFIDIMQHTWFCHYPVNNQPCGICTPCRVTIEQGMGRRIPFSGMVRNFIHYQVKPPLRKIVKPLLKKRALNPG
jgi:7-cyano-7-deazaguanine synthase in queuosine biosynthesis